MRAWDAALRVDELGRPGAGSGLRRCVLAVAASTIVGLALLTLAGWFIAASAAAGLSTASTFSFLYPSGGVQALALARTLGRYRERVVTHEATLGLAGTLRTRSFSRALRLPRDQAARLRSSDLLGRVMADVDAVDNVLLRGLFPALAAALALAAAVAVDATVSWSVAAVTAAALLGAALAAWRLARPQSGPQAARLVATRARARRELVETLEALPELRSLGAEERARAAAVAELHDYALARARLTTATARAQALTGLALDGALALSALAAAGLLVHAHLSAALFVMSCAVVLAAAEPLAGLPAVVIARARARFAAARLATDLRPARRPDGGLAPERPWTLEVGGGSLLEPSVIRPGETVLLTGRSGSGKSTLLRAVAGEPPAGYALRVGGIAPDRIAPGLLVAHVTLVAQDAYVFDGTVQTNLRLAAPDASASDLAVALGAAALAPDLLAAGLQTPTGPAGCALSGGQRRRLTVAQGLLRRPDVLLLDEPTEGLDSDGARRLLAGVRAFLPAATLVVALHDRQAFSLPWQPDHHLHLRG